MPLMIVKENSRCIVVLMGVMVRIGHWTDINRVFQPILTIHWSLAGLNFHKCHIKHPVRMRRETVVYVCVYGNVEQ